MARPRKNKDRMNDIITFRLPPVVYKVIEQGAIAAGTVPADYARNILIQHLFPGNEGATMRLIEDAGKTTMEASHEKTKP